MLTDAQREAARDVMVARLRLMSAMMCDPEHADGFDLETLMEACLRDLTDAGFLLIHKDDVTEERALLVEAVEEYADHQSWRCAHEPHYYLAGGRSGGYKGCPCGLDEFRARVASVRTRWEPITKEENDA